MRKRTSSPIPDQQSLKDMIDYNPESGIATWRERIITKPQDKTWNAVHSGKAIGGKAKTEYYWISIHNINYLLHRVIFKWMTGRDVQVVDHRDLNKKNNKWTNLREASQSQNRCNSPVGTKVGKSGVKGLSQTSDGLWKGRVVLHGKHFDTGRYSSKDDAILALERLRSKVHGEFTRHE